MILKFVVLLLVTSLRLQGSLHCATIHRDNLMSVHLVKFFERHRSLLRLLNHLMHVLFVILHLMNILHVNSLMVVVFLGSHFITIDAVLIGGLLVIYELSRRAMNDRCVRIDDKVAGVALVDDETAVNIFIRRLIDYFEALVEVALHFKIILAVIDSTILKHLHLTAVTTSGALMTFVHRVVLHRLLVLRDSLVEVQ